MVEAEWGLRADPVCAHAGRFSGSSMVGAFLTTVFFSLSAIFAKRSLDAVGSTMGPINLESKSYGLMILTNMPLQHTAVYFLMLSFTKEI